MVGVIQVVGGEVVVCVGSVIEEGFVECFVQMVFDIYGDFYIVINNVGYIWDVVIQNMSDEQFDVMIDVYFKVFWQILKVVFDYICMCVKEEVIVGEEVFCKIVNIFLMFGLCGNVGQSNYLVGKVGIIGLMKMMVKEWGCYKVNVNVVVFGYIEI